MFNADMNFTADKRCLKFLLKLVSRKYTGLQLCYFNARSFNNLKVDYINYVLQGLDIDVVCITETWFSESVCDNTCALRDYKLLRNDRKTGAKGGGVGIYCKSGVNLKIIFQSCCDDPVEYLVVEIGDGCRKCLVVCVYNPSRRFDLSGLFNEVAELAPKYEHVLLGFQY